MPYLFPDFVNQWVFQSSVCCYSLLSGLNYPNALLKMKKVEINLKKEKFYFNISFHQVIAGTSILFKATSSS